MSNSFLSITIDDDIRQVLIDVVDFWKYTRFSSMSDKDYRIHRTQCTNTINILKSGTNQITPNKISMFITALHYAYLSFRDNPDLFAEHCKYANTSLQRIEYMVCLKDIHNDLLRILASEGYSCDAPAL